MRDDDSSSSISRRDQQTGRCLGRGIGQEAFVCLLLTFVLARLTFLFLGFVGFCGLCDVVASRRSTFSLLARDTIASTSGCAAAAAG